MGSGSDQSTGVDRQGMLKPEDKAPDATLLDQHGQAFTLSTWLKRRLVLR
jgi:peroxiredoxin